MPEVVDDGALYKFTFYITLHYILKKREKYKIGNAHMLSECTELDGDGKGSM